MNPSAALAHLSHTATPERAGDKAARRLADAHDLLASDMLWVDRELSQWAAKGNVPATLAAAHLLDAGGKRVRPLSLLLSASCFGPVDARARELAVVAELVHLATLLHDDVVDDGDERRGKTAARRIWGNAVSVLAGDLLLTHALEKANAVSPGEVLGDLVATLRQLVDGEVVQLRGRTQLDVSEATYFTIVRDKTASLFGWAARTGARVAGASMEAVDALGRFGTHLGVAFQLVDDALDYAGDTNVTGKTLHTDLKEGKLTLPLIVALGHKPVLARDLTAAREGDELAALLLAGAVVESGACAQVRRLAIRETELALVALSVAPPSLARDLLACVAQDLTARLG